jgi:hypothetical protein
MNSPLTMRQLVDEYFLENRHRLLDLAAFLDRLERSADGQDPSSDFRVRALREAMRIAGDDRPDRARRAQMIFSDPTLDPRPALDRKAAYGAFNPAIDSEVK